MLKVARLPHKKPRRQICPPFVAKLPLTSMEVPKVPRLPRKASLRCKASRLPRKKPRRQIFFFYRIAERAVKHCRSSRSTTRGGMVKTPWHLQNRKTNKQTNTPQKHQTKNTNKSQTTSQRQVSEGGVKQTVKRR